MAKLAERVKKFARNLGQYPLETALCFTYFLIYVFQSPVSAALEGAGCEVEQVFVWFVPHLVLCCTLRQFKDGRVWLKYLYVLSWCLWIPLLLWCTHPSFWTVAVSYLLAALALVVGTGKMDNVSFGRHVISVVIRIAEGLIVGILLWGIICAVIASVDFLFGLSLKAGWYAYPSVFNWLVITPLLCCSLLGDSREAGKGEYLLRTVVDRVLPPALIIYAAILYGYIIWILLRWELPNGGVAYMVLAFLCVALVCYLLRMQVEDRHYKWFYNAFPAVALPPLILLWIGIFRRIGEYGITEDRFYLLLLSALVTTFVIMLFSDRSRRFQLMVLILAACAALFTFIPGIRSRDFGIRSQVSRLEKLLPEVLVDGRFPEVDYGKLAADSLMRRNYEEIFGAWQYLKDNMDSVSFVRHFGSLGDFNFSHWELTRAKNPDVKKIVLETADGPAPKRWELNDVNGNIELGEYTQFVYKVFRQADSLGLAFCNPDNHADTLLYCPVRERIANASDNTSPDEVLVYENGSYKAVILSVLEKDGYPYYLANTNSLLFKKP